MSDDKNCEFDKVILSAGGLREIRSKIVGITFDNRMEFVKQLKQGEQLFLKREKDNQYDKNAVALENKSGNPLGYLKKELSLTIAPEMDSEKYTYECFVKEITGGIDKKNLGINIIILEKTKKI
jgi:single-stranded-DNA-specific exonuclease